MPALEPAVECSDAAGHPAEGGNSCADSAEASVARLRDLRDGPRALPHIVSLGTAAVPHLERLLCGPSESIDQPRSLSAAALGLIGGSAATDALLRALDDCVHRKLEPILEHVEYVVINAIAENLGEIADPRSSGGLIAALESGAYPACVDALARLGDSRAVPVLAERLHADVTRDGAAEALRRFDPAIVRPHLVRALSNRRLYEGAERAAWVSARAAAATLLGELGGAERELGRALDDDQPRVREAAALVLAAEGHPTSRSSTSWSTLSAARTG